MSHAQVIAARENLIRQVIRLLSGERSEPHAYSAAEVEYAQELVALAARDLAEATDGLPQKDRPVGWARSDPSELNEGDWVTVTFRMARVSSEQFYEDDQPFLTVGHDAFAEFVDVALTDDVTVVFVTTEADRVAKLRAVAERVAASQSADSEVAK